MKELARKGGISIRKDEDYAIYWQEVDITNKWLDADELSDLKDCINTVTAKKWINRYSHFECPDCGDRVQTSNTQYCKVCGLKLDGVEE